MKKITMVVMIVSIILAFMPINQVVAAESASIGLAIDVVKGVFEIAKTIKGSNTNQDVNLGKEIEVYQVNSKNVLVSDGSYKKKSLHFLYRPRQRIKISVSCRL